MNVVRDAFDLTFRYWYYDTMLILCWYIEVSTAKSTHTHRDWNIRSISGTKCLRYEIAVSSEYPYSVAAAQALTRVYQARSARDVPRRAAPPRSASRRVASRRIALHGHEGRICEAGGGRGERMNYEECEWLDQARLKRSAPLVASRRRWPASRDSLYCMSRSGYTPFFRRKAAGEYEAFPS